MLKLVKGQPPEVGLYHNTTNEHMYAPMILPLEL